MTDLRLQSKRFHRWILKLQLSKTALIGLLFWNACSCAQKKMPISFIDSSIENLQIVYTKPIDSLELEPYWLKRCVTNLPASAKKLVDSTVLIEIFKNAAKMDNTPWSDEEPKRAILITDESKSVHCKRTLKKFSFLEQSEYKGLKKLIKTYNFALAAELRVKDRHYYSRPVFDNSGQFAAI